MKEFKLKRVKYKNIMSVGQKPIEIQLDKVHKSLVTGKNGGGKSTILEAITFALFGRPFRDVKKGQLINSSNKKDLYVELDMEFNGQTFEIVRGQKPNIFKIKRNGQDLDESASAKDFQEHFEQLIGMNYSSFKQVVVLGTAGYTPFMGLSTPARRKLVEDLLEVSVLADMDKTNKIAIRELNQEISILDTKIIGIRTNIKTHEEYQERQKKLSGDNIRRFKTMYDDLVSEIRTHKDTIINIGDQITALVLPEDPEPDLNKLGKEIGSMDHDIVSYEKVIRLYNNGGSCPTCMQQLDSSNDLISKVKDKHFTLTGSIAGLHDKRLGLLDIKEEYVSIKKQITLLRVKQDQIKQLALAAGEKAKKVKAAIDQAKSEYVDNSDKIKELNDELNSQIESKSALVVEKYRRGVITEMLKDTGIKGSIVKKYVPLFNKQINSYLKIMGADYVFTLNEEFNETIKSRGREDFSYSSFSQGEKARIDIALLFTWRNIASLVTGVNISTLILDEVFDSATDVEGVKAISTILNQMQKTNVFIISHRDHNPEDYGQHIQMRKVGRFTEME